MKILSRKNGIALVAVLAVLLVLTLLLPVMFRSSESAMRSAGTELSRQKAGYLARTGAEMAVASIKTTLKDDSYDAFYEALRNKDRVTADQAAADTNLKVGQRIGNELYGIRLNDEGFLHFKMQPINLYQQYDSEGNVIGSEYISGTNVTAPEGYEYVGTAEITVEYNDDPQYYEVDSTTGAYTEVEESEAYGPVDIKTERGDVIQVNEIKENYVAIYNDNYKVKSTATVQGQTATRAAVVIETVDMLNNDDPNDSFIAHTGQYWREAPEFVRTIQGDTNEAAYVKDGKKWVVDLNKDYVGLGCNQVMANPFKATSKKTIKAFGKGLNGVSLNSDDYYNKDVYIYSVIGNMNLNLPNEQETLLVKDIKGRCGGDFTHYYALGAFPGTNWRVHESPKAQSEANNRPSIQAMNFDSNVSGAQSYNFVSFCATDTLQVSLPVELRVNPKRTNRTGDGNETNCTLFKVMNFQAKDIVFKKRVDLFTSICIDEWDGLGGKRTPEVKAYRGGFLNLSAPKNTPYTYYNKDRNETVSAGIVYFHEPVYLWFQNYDALGANSSWTSDSDIHIMGFASETMYRVPLITSSDDSRFKLTYGTAGKADAIYKYAYDKKADEDLMVFKVFDKGDVYYFNSEIMGKITETQNGKQVETEVNMGVNIANWFLETKYIKAVEAENRNNFWSYVTDLKKTLYYNYLSDSLENDGTYVLDDMHYIGNLNDDPLVTVPEVEDELHVVWDN